MKKVTTEKIFSRIIELSQEQENPIMDEAIDDIFDQLEKIAPNVSFNAREAEALSQTLSKYSIATSLVSVQVVIEMLSEMGVVNMEGVNTKSDQKEDE